MNPINSKPSRSNAIKKLGLPGASKPLSNQDDTIRTIPTAQNREYFSMRNAQSMADAFPTPPKYQRRGSASSDGSTGLTNFRERFSTSNSSSSSSSGSDSRIEPNVGRTMTSIQASTKTRPPSSFSRSVGDAFGRSKTQREIRRLVEAFLTTDISHVKLSTTAIILLKHCSEPEKEADIIKYLTSGAHHRVRTLETLFTLSDMEVDECLLLRASSTSAQLMDIVMKAPKMGRTVGEYLDNTTAVSGIGGVRYLLKTPPASFALIPDLNSLLLRYVTQLSASLLKTSGGPRSLYGGMTSERKRATQLTLRLWELMLQKRIVDPSQLSAEILHLITYGDFFYDPMPLNILRSFADTAPSTFPADIITQSLVNWIPRSWMSACSNAKPEVICLAFSALAIMLRYGTLNEADHRLRELIVDVLLWRTEWQHITLKKFTRNWDIPGIIPHDDAYTMLSFYRPQYSIPTLSSRFAAASLAGSYEILEALLALIVDRSAQPDPYWPTMLSTLIQAGMVDYLTTMTRLALPNPQYHLYRVVQGAKRDGATGILRCFEQMLARDVRCIGCYVFDTLEYLVMDETQPLSVQHVAKMALETWDRNLGGLRPYHPIQS